jgi:hypothetical protein
MHLRQNPLEIFAGSRTPVGLYARQKWLGEEGTSPWKEDFQETVRALLDGQADDGSWNSSALETVRRLFGLHLTLRNSTGESEKALAWLKGCVLARKAWEKTASLSWTPLAELGQLPFSPGQPRHLLVCATLFLAAVFQQGEDPLIRRAYETLTRWVSGHPDHPETWTDQGNALRALVVFPDFAGHPATAALVDRLERLQDARGLWPAPISWTRTINALAHSPLASAHRQWLRVSDRIEKTQNDDGSWGNEDREWDTFLVVHALRNKGRL